MPYLVTAPQANDPITGDERPSISPLLYSIPDARRRCGGLGNTRAYELIAAGHWIAVKLGGRTFVTAASLDKFIMNLRRADIRAGRNSNVSKKLKQTAAAGGSGELAPA
jgi:hypothetical protein